MISRAARFAAALVAVFPSLVSAQQVVIESLTAVPGAAAVLVGRLAAGANLVGGAQLDIELPTIAANVVAKPNGNPDCIANPLINREQSAFGFQPRNCSGDSCTAVRAIIFDFVETAPIADGAELFSCTLQVRFDAPLGAHVLGAIRVVLSNPEGVRIQSASGVDGTLTVALATATPTSTATLTATSTPTSTATRTHTPTPTASPSPTSTATATLTSPPSPTASETPTSPASPTASETPTLPASPTATQTPPASMTPTSVACAGDCNRDGEVTIDELLLLVNIALELNGVAICPAGDGNSDTQVTIDEVLLAVNIALGEC